MSISQSCTAPRKSWKASQKRLREIEEALSQMPASPTETWSQTPRPTGREKRLKDIEDALAGIGIFSQMNKIDMSTISQTPRPLTGREMRLKDIEDALAGKDVSVSSQMTQIDVSTFQLENLKRASCSAPESPPKAKRRHLSPDSPDLSPLSSPTNTAVFLPGCLSSSTTAEIPTPELIHSSPSPSPMSPPDADTEVLHRHTAREILPSNIDSHLDVFFRKYPGFRFNPKASVTAQFHRMCGFYNWNRNDRKRKAAQQGFQDALSQDFNNTYGTEVQDLTSWQRLCIVLEIHPIPEDLEECQDAVLSTHINIVDLVDTHKTGQPVQKFASELELSEYTIKHGKFFPRENAYAGGLLKFLLRRIFDPPSGKRTHKRRRRWRA